MAFQIKKFIKKYIEIETVDYKTTVYFHKPCYSCEHILTSNDTLTPANPALPSADAKPVPGFGALYRLIGDGSHSPSFDASFKKSSASGDYDSTEGVVNLISFLYDGADFWYSIIQPQ